MDRKTEIIAVSPIELREHEAHERLIPSSAASLEDLRKSVAAEGRVRVPLVALPDGRVLCGRDRLKVARELGLPEVPVEIRQDLADDPDGQILLIVDDNLSRKHFSEPERVKLAALRLTFEKKLSKARQIAAGREGGRLAGRGRPKKGAKGSGNSSGPLSDSRDRVAATIGLSGRQLEKALKVVEAAKGRQAPIAKLYMDGTISASCAHDAMERLSRKEQTRLVARVRHAPEGAKARVARQAVRGRVAQEREERDGDPFVAVLTALLALGSAGSTCLRADPGFAKGWKAMPGEWRPKMRRLLDEASAAIEALELHMIEG